MTKGVRCACCGKIFERICSNCWCCEKCCKCNTKNKRWVNNKVGREK